MTTVHTLCTMLTCADRCTHMQTPVRNVNNAYMFTCVHCTQANMCTMHTVRTRVHDWA